MKNNEQNITDKAKVVFDQHPHFDHASAISKDVTFYGFGIYPSSPFIILYLSSLCVKRCHSS